MTVDDRLATIQSHLEALSEELKKPARRTERFTADEVREIRILSRYYYYKDLAKKYGCSPITIGKIARYETYRYT